MNDELGSSGVTLFVSDDDGWNFQQVCLPESLEVGSYIAN